MERMGLDAGDADDDADVGPLLFLFVYIIFRFRFIVDDEVIACATASSVVVHDALLHLFTRTQIVPFVIMDR